MDHKLAVTLGTMAAPALKPANDLENPYFKVVSSVDKRLQEMEMDATAGQQERKAWGAPTPSQDAVGRSLSKPLLKSDAAQKARLTAHEQRLLEAEQAVHAPLMVAPAYSSTQRPGTSAGSRRGSGTGTGAGAGASAPSSRPQSARPPSAARRPSTGGRAATASTAASSASADPQATIRQLEEEVQSLRATLDILTASKAAPNSGSAGMAAFRGGPVKAGSAASSRTATTVLASPQARAAEAQVAAAATPEEKVAAMRAQRDAYIATLEETLVAKKAHDGHISVLQMEASLVASAKLRPAYKRQMPAAFGKKQFDENGNVVVHAEAKPARRASVVGSGSRRASVAGGAATAAARRASVAAAAAATPAAARRASVQQTAEPARRSSVAAAAPSSSSSTSAAAHSSDSKDSDQQQQHQQQQRPSTAAPRLNTTTAATAAKKAPESPSGPDRTTTRRGMVSGLSPSRPVSPTRQERLAAISAYTSPPGFKKHPAAATQTAAFSFTQNSRLKELSIRERKFMADLAAKQAAEEAALHYQFKAQPVPETTRANLFESIMKAQEERRDIAHHSVQAKLAASIQPFTTVEAHCKEHEARSTARRARHELSIQRELAEGRKFHANPVPSTTQNPDGSYVKLLQREAERGGRIKAMARTLQAEAALPRRMMLAEEEDRRKKAEREAAKREGEARDKAAFRFRANSLPNFATMQAAFYDSLISARSTFGMTTVQPFGFDQPERIQKDLARKEKWIKEYELETSHSMVLRQRSRSHSVSGGGGEGYDPHASTRTGGSRRMSTGGKSHQSIAAKLAVSSAPPASMTRSSRLKMMASQQRIRERQAAEQARAVEDEQLRRADKSATRKMAPLIQAMEAERLKHGPLAWQLDSVMASASDARRSFLDASRRRYAENQARIEAAQKDRPLLMLRSSIEWGQEIARRNALLSVAKTTATAASRALGSTRRTSTGSGDRERKHLEWEDVAANGVGGVDLFSQEERELMALGSPQQLQQQGANAQADEHGPEEHQQDVTAE